MCPLRLILIFLSASLAGFFVLRNLKAQPDLVNDDAVANPSVDSSSPPPPRSTKVCSAIGSAFWTCVDMASGRYLWRNLTASSAKSSD
ncbi:unnamed protein product [Rhodiola kirilowii]